MSLKAKIEAVIYAAEEPVTLAQLLSLLGGEAEAELRRIASAQQALPLIPDTGDVDPLPPAFLEKLNEEVFDGAPVQIDSGPETDQEARAGDLPTEDQGKKDTSRDAARDEKERTRQVRDLLRDLLDDLVRDYATPDRGLEIREVAGGFRLATKPEYHDAVRGFVKSLKPPLKLSLQALETLAVVAYKQPVTAPEISEIRGVDSGGVLGSLMARKLVTTAGRKQVIGRPILYRTTKDFLLRFGLKDIQELPSIEEFEKMAGELRETEPLQEEIRMPAENPHTDPELARADGSSAGSITDDNLEEERGSVEAQADGDGAPIDTISPDGRLAGVFPPQSKEDDTDTSAKEVAVPDSERGDESQE